MSNYRKALFPIHIYQTHIKENELIKDELSNNIDKYVKDKSLKIPDGWLTDSLQTSYEYDSINIELFDSNSIVHDYYMKYLFKIFDKPVELNIKEMWFNYYSNGEYQEPHHHIDGGLLNNQSHFSCIHYLKFNENIHEPAIFTDPVSLTRAHSVEMDSNNYVERYIPNVREGTLLMFPSYLEHYVRKNAPTPDDPRVTIAFNIVVTKYGDDDGN
tara:strand:+ start:244 stop:885 length:642 start_codon:yes stop_codon:yes gene_type:complete